MGGMESGGGVYMPCECIDSINGTEAHLILKQSTTNHSFHFSGDMGYTTIDL